MIRTSDLVTTQNHHRITEIPVPTSIPNSSHREIRTHCYRVDPTKYCRTATTTDIFVFPQSSGGFWGGVTECGLGMWMFLMEPGIRFIQVTQKRHGRGW
jgi:hypothetical protein